MRNTDGKRLYAIGDIHGCIGELNRVLADIADDLERRPHPDPLVIFLGDYTDRGPDSRGTIDRLIEVRDSALPSAFLFGNHDQRFLAFLDEPEAMSTEKYHWLDAALGGDKTVASYGVPNADLTTLTDTHEAFSAAVPSAHIAFLREAEVYKQVGTYTFVHAGIRPGVAMPDQDVEDLIWIRDPFLHFKGDHGFVVVHGHTPVKRIENRGNRIDVDTGAVFGRHLSCLVLEDDTQSQLVGHNLLSCPPELSA